MPNEVQKELRRLPSVDRLLQVPGVQALLQENGHNLTVAAIQDVLAEARQAIQQETACPSLAELETRVAARLSIWLHPSLYPVLNATGIIVHTNLGRAPLSSAAQEAMRAASGYCNLEYDIEAGERGSRYVHAEALLRRLTGAEAALVVNNAAAGVLLILAVLAREREVIISRGELVEIGGGFRIPEVLAQSGARLVEVGTTNRTYLRDYEAAITPQTAMLLHVHTSNFRVVGFTHATALADLVTLARAKSLSAVHDLGSGALLDTASFGLSHEPTVQESLGTGVDLTCISGDKLLGGPQAGIILGKSEPIAALKRHPLTRALRVSKVTLAGLQATLLHYLRNEALQCIPVWQMISAEVPGLEARAEALATWLRATHVSAEVVDGWSMVGGGSLPGQMLPTRLVAIPGKAPNDLARKLRLGHPPVIGHVENEALLLDLRTVLPAQEEALRQALRAAL